MSKEIKEKCKECVYYNERMEYPKLDGTTTHSNCMSIKCDYRKATKDLKIIRLNNKISDLEAKLAESEDYIKYNIPKFIEANKRMAEQLAEKQEQYQDAVSNCVNLANTRAILKLKKVQDRIDDMKSKYDCDIEYHLGANNELTHLWEYINKLIEEMSNGEV